MIKITEMQVEDNVLSGTVLVDDVKYNTCYLLQEGEENLSISVLAQLLCADTEGIPTTKNFDKIPLKVEKKEKKEIVYDEGRLSKEESMIQSNRNILEESQRQVSETFIVTQKIMSEMDATLLRISNLEKKLAK